MKLRGKKLLQSKVVNKLFKFLLLSEYKHNENIKDSSQYFILAHFLSLKDGLKGKTQCERDGEEIVHFLEV